jgi:hypothetical protein
VFRMTYRFALLVLLFVPAGLRADAEIPETCRISNRPPGRCGWCAVETLARHQQIKTLYGLTENHACRSSPEDLEAALAASKVAYHIQFPGEQKTAILDTALRDGRGAAVGFREVEPGKGPHIVTIVAFGSEKVKVIDPNDSDCRVRTMTRERFLYWWDGFALTLDALPKPGTKIVGTEKHQKYGNADKTR